MKPRLELDPGSWPAGGDVSIALDSTLWKIGPSRRLTVVAKCTIQLVGEGAAQLIAAEPLASSTVELAPALPHPQITLVGHAYAPTGTRCGMQPARIALVRGRTTIFDKSILVYGDRASPTDFAQPFDVMPLVHERAPGSGWNPVGRVLARGDVPPNLVPVAPGQPIACFAPIPAGFPARAAIFDASAVRRDDDLLAFGLFDFRWFQDAPFDQWLPPLEGGETLVLEGLSPHLPRLATDLPAMLVQASWWHARGDGGRVRLRLGRIDVDVDRGVASLIWRGHFALPSGAVAGDMLVRVSTRGTTGGTTLADIAGGDDEDGPPTRAGLPRRVLASMVDVSRATLADVSHATLADVARATLAEIDGGDSDGPVDAPRSGTLPFRGPPPVVTAPAAPTGPAPPPAAPTGPAPPSQRELLGRLLDGSLAGDALRAADLSGVSLVNADLAGRDLRGARLAGANADGARLQGACLDGADLTGATLRGADLETASLVGAKLAGADLGKASLRHAVLDGADAEGARFAGADLTRSRGARGRFVRARFDGARLDEAQWPEAMLDGASFVDAFLCRATITKGSFVRANLTRADLREASMQGAAFGAALCDATGFDRADLSGADFVGAHLNEGALRRARTTGAKLR